MGFHLMDRKTSEYEFSTGNGPILRCSAFQRFGTVWRFPAEFRFGLLRIRAEGAAVGRTDGSSLSSCFR